MTSKYFAAAYLLISPLSLVAQTEVPLGDDLGSESIEKKAGDLPARGSQSSETNPSETFKDPFAEPPIETPAIPDPFLPTPEVTPVPTLAPTVSAPTPAPQIPVPTPAVQQPKFFDFPTEEDVKGPVSVDYLKAKKFEAERKEHTWNINPSLGAAFNVNRRYNQFHLEIAAGYRLKEVWEVGGSIYYRTVKDGLIGFLGTVKRSLTLKNTRDMRIDWLPGASLGWTLRKAPSGSKFSEGRMPIRLNSEFIFYPYPRFGITAMTALEMFLFAIDTDGTSTNFLSKGIPAQLILSVGTRWEF